jgi:hypothetical protein
MGVLTAALGVFLIVYPLATTTITAVLLGWGLIFVGIALFVFALHSQTVGNFFLKILLSLLYGICGIALAFFPVAGVAALTLTLGTLLLIQAGMLTAIAFQLKPMEGWGWFLADATTSAAERSDFRQVALHRDLDNWDAGWRVSADERNFQDHDRNQDTDWRRHHGTTFSSGVATIFAARTHAGLVSHMV